MERAERTMLQRSPVGNQPFVLLLVGLVAWVTSPPRELLDLQNIRPGDALPVGWTVRPVRGSRAPASTVRDSSGERFLRIEGRGTAAWFVRALEPAESPTRGRLTWRWRVPLAPLAADVRDRDRDDAALRIFVVFDHRGFLSRVPRTIFYTVTPPSLAGYQARSKQSSDLMIVGIPVAAPGMGWNQTTRDPLSDYRAFWHATPPRILAIGLMQDAEQTHSAVMADIVSLTWSNPDDVR